MNWTIHTGDARRVVAMLPAGLFHCCVTSPPYWGLRDYGVDGQLGLEATPEQYVARLVEVFREVRRVLRGDATLWLNLGDSYATGAGRVGDCPGGGDQGDRWTGPATQPNRMPPPGLKPKDLVGIPWRVAFALQADGWWLRSDIVWSKPNPMPESVTDRPTKAHEYLFLLAAGERYYYDQESIAEPAVYGDHPRNGTEHYSCQAPGQPMQSGITRARRSDKQRGHSRRHAGFNDRWDAMSHEEQRTGMRNRRTVWTVATEPYAGAHFAVMPTALVEPCILAGCPPGGIVLDPFAGAGTVGVVARRLGRQFVGVELNPAYVDMARRRIEDDAPMFNRAAAP